MKKCWLGNRTREKRSFYLLLVEMKTGTTTMEICGSTLYKEAEKLIKVKIDPPHVPTVPLLSIYPKDL